jgi:hypothetical protein
MESSLGIVLIIVALAMIFYGKARNGVTQEFLQSYPVGIAYMMTVMILLVFGVVLTIMMAL